ncbi:unnamed protein product [Mytilus coruscus]|uniref:Uncharacterized protein n=1 Tax=Mytilus coruscus TaxID=42192 RepID=A0A6J8DBH9_MYTCO|nr:unnamed protein product [Mytilus coruscus]
MSLWKQNADKVVSEKVINKRVLGRLIIQYVGNEGAEIDARRDRLRKLFQATIDYIQNHDVPGIWKNARVTVYDSEDNTVKVESGNGKNKFMVTEKEKKTADKTHETTEYRIVTEAHEAVDIILRDNPHLSKGPKDMLRELRTDIYDALDGETNARISIYVGDKNEDEPFKFKIGSGSQHLIVDIFNDKVKHKFSSRSFWSRVYKGTTVIFYGIVAMVSSIRPNPIENKKTQ